MLKKLFCLVSFLCILSGTTPVFAAIPTDDFDDAELTEQTWEIPVYKSDIIVDKYGDLHITETITADFTKYPSHGIYRYIPHHYKSDTRTIDIRLKIKSVTDTRGTPLQYTEKKTADDIMLRIGDPNVYLDNIQTYIIQYEATDVPLTNLGETDPSKKDLAQIYWNVNGIDWEVPIKYIKSTVTLPQAVDPENMQGACYTGVYKEKNANCTFMTDKRGQIFQFETTKPFEKFENLTIVAGFPPNILQPLPWSEQLLQTIRNIVEDHWPLFIPFFLLIFLLKKWYTTGRDPEGTRTTIIPHYTPPANMGAIEVGTLVDDSADMNDISAEIVNLAIKGYLQFDEIRENPESKNPSDYKFTLKKSFENDATLFPYQKTLLTSIFETEKDILLSALKNKFYKKIKPFKDEIYTKLVNEKLYTKNPDSVRATYYVIAGFMFIGSMFLMQALIEFMAIDGIIAIFGSSAIIGLFGHFMPQKTVEGVNRLYEIKGLEEYIRTAEKDRIEFQEKNGILFEKLLPYAMVFGMADRWGKAFEGIYTTPPDWYHGSFGNNFTTWYFIHNLNSMSTQVQNTFVSSPRSSNSGGWSGGGGFGGGFSGGGFGGGGGGRW